MAAYTEKSEDLIATVRCRVCLKSGNQKQQNKRIVFFRLTRPALPAWCSVAATASRVGSYASDGLCGYLPLLCVSWVDVEFLQVVLWFSIDLCRCWRFGRRQATRTAASPWCWVTRAWLSPETPCSSEAAEGQTSSRVRPMLLLNLHLSSFLLPRHTVTTFLS